MKLSVHYHDANIDLQLPDGWQVDVFDPPFANHQPIDFATGDFSELRLALSDFAARQDNLVVINDQFRATPSATLLANLFSVSDIRRLKILIATGVHPKPEREVIKKLVGERVFDGAEILVHSAFDPDEIVTLGSGDQKVGLNRHLVDADAIYVIGSVEPHYFAGFTGGRKAFLPGCAAFEDIEKNHAFAVSETSQPLASRGNPVWEDIKQRTAVLDDKEITSSQVVCDARGNVYFHDYGPIDFAYQSACCRVRRQAATAIGECYDLVISVVYPPFDRNLYQLQKSYENVKSAVADGGTVLLISACYEGIGNSYFIELARSLDAAGGAKGADGGKPTGEGGVMGTHKVQRTQRLAERINLVLFAELKQGDVDPLPIKISNNLEQTIEDLMEKYGPSCRVAVVLDSASQVLYSD